MSPASAQLLELLGQLRGASRLGRTRVLARAANQLRSLSADERRVLATEAARRAAPHLLPKVDDLVHERLDASEARKFVELLNKLDGDAIADLADGVALALEGPPPAEPIELPAGEWVEDGASSYDDEQEDSVDIVADLQLDHAQPEPLVLVDQLHDQPPSLDEPWNVTPDGEVTALVVDPTEGPLPGSPGIGRGGGGGDDADPSVPPLPAAGVAQPGLAVIPEPIRVVEPLDDPDLLERLRAVPDGWRRRRLALDLVARAAIRPDQSRQVVTMFARESDRAWVAGALLDAAAISLDELADLLPRHALDRLSRRQAV